MTMNSINIIRNSQIVIKSLMKEIMNLNSCKKNGINAKKNVVKQKRYKRWLKRKKKNSVKRWNYLQEVQNGYKLTGEDY